MQFLNVITYKIPPQHRYPDHPPRRVSTRNEICLTANEILIRKVKYDKSDEISLREVEDNRNVIE